MKSFIFILSLFTPIQAFCNCVAMRMDDVQDYWLTQTQIDVMNVFKNTNTPLTSLIIGADFGEDSVIVNAIKDNLAYAEASGWDFEVGNHGWLHNDFTELSASDQNIWLRQARSSIMGYLNGHITDDNFITFVPPLNKFNNETIDAAIANGFTIMSAGASEYADMGRSYPGEDPIFREFPMQASTTDLADIYRVSSLESFQMIQDQISVSGFSVLMMHFVEFTDANGNTNQTSLDDLANLIQMLKNAGITITNLRGLDTLYSGLAKKEVYSIPTPSHVIISNPKSDAVSTSLQMLVLGLPIIIAAIFIGF